MDSIGYETNSMRWCERVNKWSDDNSKNAIYAEQKNHNSVNFERNHLYSLCQYSTDTNENKFVLEQKTHTRLLFAACLTRINGDFSRNFFFAKHKQ